MPVLDAPLHSTALDDPAASMTARTSSIVVSMDCTSRGAVRETRPALVEHQDAPDRGQPLDVTDEQRLLPRRQQVARDAAHEDDVRRTVAHDL